MTTLAPASAAPVVTVLDVLARIGDDYALAPGEIGDAAADATGALPSLWDIYERHWGRFCGARLDPMFHALEHPARLTGDVHVVDGAPCVVVGTGPSLAPALPALRRVRPALHLITSPRGAEVLAAADLVPDLVVVEHQSALDAQFSVGERAHRLSTALGRVPLVAADARTPAALLVDVSADRLFVPARWPSWGLWPATAVALALAGGAARVGLVGVDLGTTKCPDPAHHPLRDLLGLLSTVARVPCLDLGTGGAPKTHWTPATVAAVAAPRPVEPLHLAARPWCSLAERRELAAERWHRLGALATQASATLAVAGGVRDGDRSPVANRRLRDRLEQLLAAGRDVATRMDVQGGLGAGFLPRYWRTPPDLDLGPQLWRPAALASHELVAQHRALARRLGQEA